DIGDNLGVVLEEVFTGTRGDVQSALDEANEYATEVMQRAQKRK
ncbi:sugar ABC transporter substrate-binding protein, partial [Streptococcus danieliae]|nr:sugar ABC transporter substrate-binding protein [Streptococcus danieliae]